MPAEAQLGITEFISKDVAGFSGLIKERFSDFNVYEVDQSGVVVRLRDQTIPIDDADKDNESNKDQSYSSLNEVQQKIISEEQFVNISNINSSELTDTLRINVTDLDKDARKQIHGVLKQFSNIESNTREMTGGKFIEVCLKKNFKGGGRRDWPRERPKYLHFTLYKENMETAEAVGLLAGKVRSNEKYFGFAGTKDRRGRTTQRVSASMISAQQILGAAKHIHKIEVGDFSYEKSEIRLGQLFGNRFELAIRDVEVSEEDLQSSMTSFSEVGFINYFGTQRFGTQGIPTHVIGKELILGNYKKVINLILEPRESESMEALKKARQIWSEEKDAKKAFSVLKSNRKDRTIEGKLLYGLSNKHENDHVGVLEELPRQQRLLYCHAYQSYVWNKVVSRRIKDHGLKVLKGDLVYKDESLRSEDDSKEDKVEFVEDPDQHELQDVLIPIPGHKVKFPSNEMKDWFEQYLAEDGLTLNSFESSVKDYRLPGDYRNIVVRPRDVEWRLVNYDDCLTDLIPSAKEKLNKSSVDNIKSDGKLKALILSFSLSSSCYATMALREIMKVETDRASLAARSINNKRTLSDESSCANKLPKL